MVYSKRKFVKNVCKEHKFTREQWKALSSKEKKQAKRDMRALYAEYLINEYRKDRKSVIIMRKSSFIWLIVLLTLLK